MNVWLYPVSGNGRHTFRDSTGRRRPTAADEIRDSVTGGTFPETAEWTCVQNGSNVAPGDRLYLYAGDVGIFAAGIVAGARPSKKTTEGGAPLWLLAWELDAERTQRLLERPVPAEDVRKHVHPRVTVRNFNEGARALRRKLGG